MTRTSHLLAVVLLVACGREIGLTQDAKPPVANIVSPQAAETIPQALTLDMQGAVSDPDTKTDKLVTRWLFRDTVICEEVVPDAEGVTRCQLVTLTPGAGTVRLEVEDPEGETAEAEVDITIEGSAAPIATLDAVGPYLESVATLTGQVSDADDPLAALDVWWESSLDGVVVPRGAPPSDGVVTADLELTPGPHSLVLWVEDPLGQTANAGVDVTVVAVEDVPTIAITSPRDGARQVQSTGTVFEADLTDPDDPPTTLDVVWHSDIDGELASGHGLVDGTSIEEVRDLTLGVHRITATVTDPAGRSAEDYLSIVVDGPPSAPGIRILPEDPLTTDRLRVEVVTPSVDPNGDPVSYIFGWTEASSPDIVSVGELLAPSDTESGDVWTATVTPWDGRQEGEPATAEVTILNSIPTVTVALTPGDPDTTTDLVADWDAEDADGDDDLTVEFTWRVDGAPTGVLGDVLVSRHFVRGQTVSVTVVPNDGIVDGDPAVAEVLIGNARPSAPEVTIVPAEPTPDDDLQCTITGPSTDPDGDAIVYTFDWDVDGEVFGDAETIDWPQDTVPAEFTTANQEWVCTVVPVDDLFTTGPAGLDFVEIPCVVGQDAACPAESCLDVLEGGHGVDDGTYWVRPGDSTFEAYCDLTRDGGGWTLVGQVHRAELDGVSEPVGWFGDGNNAGHLADDTEIWNEAPSAHGAARLGGYFDAHVSVIARFDLVGQDSGDVERTWYKGASADAFATWFAEDVTPTPVCADPDLTVDCMDGTIATGNREEGPALGATPLVGMEVAPGCPILMRLDDDLGAAFSAISACDGGLGIPTDYADEWGHGLEIWLR